MKLLSRFAFLFLLFAVGLAITVINLLGRHHLPADPLTRISSLREAGFYLRAEIVYEELISAELFDLDLHYNYINNHFDITSSTRSYRSDAEIESSYVCLAEAESTADIGNYGLGLISAVQGDFEGALGFYRAVRNHDQKYLNNSIGYVCLKQDLTDSAEFYFWREIDLNGNVSGAVANLAKLYSEINDLT